MKYLTFALDSEGQNLCIISSPFALYKYKQLPMGIKQIIQHCPMRIKQSSNIAQDVMEILLCDLNDVEIYIDDIGSFPSTFASHIQTLDEILT
jgi:hypothetical protein